LTHSSQAINSPIHARGFRFLYDLKKECMEMVKYFALALALVGSLAVADLAEARGRRGCSSCSVGGGCPGGVCYAPVAPAKMAATSNAPPPAVVAAPDAPPAAAAQPAPRSYATSSNARRGLFGWRR
jgi:hypothetical protein